MKSIRKKLWLGMMILICLVILMLWFFQIVFLENFYSVFEVRDIIKKANNIITDLNEYEDLSQVQNTDTLIEEFDLFANQKQLSLQLIDTEQTIVYQTDGGNSMFMHGVYRQSVNDVLASAFLGNTAKITVTHQRFGNQFEIIALPVLLQKEQGALLLTVPLTAVEDTVAILKEQLIIITLFLFLISVLLSFWLSKSFTKPILDISRVAKAYSDGSFDTRTTYLGKDELGQLADRMNVMGEALQSNDLLQKELIANVSHELKTPLTLIRGYAETLRDVTGSDPIKREKQLNVIVDETNRLHIIVDDILNLSKLQAGAIVPVLKPFFLQELLQDVQGRYELYEKHRVLRFTGLNELSETIIGDRRLIEQVFYNLINNALIHAGSDAIVQVRTLSSGQFVRIEVTDNGNGIPEENLEHIFDRYYKVRSADPNPSKGSGLGLAIVKSILELHKAPYGVISKPGIGTTFWFELMK